MKARPRPYARLLARWRYVYCRARARGQGGVEDLVSHCDGDSRDQAPMETFGAIGMADAIAPMMTPRTSSRRLQRTGTSM